MGNWFSNWFNFKTEKKLLMLGLDAAGKTTILYKMKLGEMITSIPTIGKMFFTLYIIVFDDAAFHNRI